MTGGNLKLGFNQSSITCHSQNEILTLDQDEKTLGTLGAKGRSLVEAAI